MRMSDHAGGVETYITNLCEELDKVFKIFSATSRKIRR